MKFFNQYAISLSSTGALLLGIFARTRSNISPVSWYFFATMSVREDSHSWHPHQESGGAKFIWKKSISGGAGWCSKTWWEFSIQVGHEFLGGAFDFSALKIFFALQILFHMKKIIFTLSNDIFSISSK